MYRIGIIGCEGRILHVVNQQLEKADMVLTAVADPRVEDMRELFANRKKNPTLYPDAESILAAENLDAIMIGTRCSLHTPMALLAAKANVPIFLEKPGFITEEQLSALETLLPMQDKIVVSFPLRRTNLVEEVKKVIDSGVLGRIVHVEAWNNVSYGRGYFKKWYHDDSETGGLFLQKATHDLDYVRYLIGGEKPVRVCAVKSKQVFKGDMPAGSKCLTCAKTAECPESPQNLALAHEPANGDNCCFAVDTGNEDSGSMIVEFESGMHAVYPQNFIVRKTMGSRGARLVEHFANVIRGVKTSKTRSPRASKACVFAWRQKNPPRSTSL